jgi:hypothetical protein
MFDCLDITKLAFPQTIDNYDNSRPNLLIIPQKRDTFDHYHSFAATANNCLPLDCTQPNSPAREGSSCHHCLIDHNNTAILTDRAIINCLPLIQLSLERSQPIGRSIATAKLNPTQNCLI